MGDGDDTDGCFMGEYVGSIKGKDDGGNGIIECDEAENAKGKGVCVPSALMKRCRLSINDIIAFNLHTTKSDKDRALVAQPFWMNVSPFKAAPKKKAGEVAKGDSKAGPSAADKANDE